MIVSRSDNGFLLRLTEKEASILCLTFSLVVGESGGCLGIIEGDVAVAMWEALEQAGA